LNDTEHVVRDGKVALRQIGKTNIPVPISIEGTSYQASLQNNIWLLWVDEPIAQRIIESPNNKVKSCSCNDAAWRTLFKYADELDVSLYLTGDRPR